MKTNVAPETEQKGEAEGEARGGASNQGDSRGDLGEQVGACGDGSGGQNDDVSGQDEASKTQGAGAGVHLGHRGNDDGNGVGRGDGGAAAGGERPVENSDGVASALGGKSEPVENTSRAISTANFPPTELPPVENSKVKDLNAWKQRRNDFPPVDIPPPVENTPRRGRGRPRTGKSIKPYAPANYEWREDSGGWKFIHRPVRPGGKKGYAYIGFLSPDRWNYFKRFDDERFIKFVGKFFEQRKGRSVRAGRLGQAGG